MLLAKLLSCYTFSIFTRFANLVRLFNRLTRWIPVGFPIHPTVDLRSEPQVVEVLSIEEKDDDADLMRLKVKAADVGRDPLTGVLLKGEKKNTWNTKKPKRKWNLIETYILFDHYLEKIITLNAFECRSICVILT